MKITHPEFFDDSLFLNMGHEVSENHDDGTTKLRMDYESNKEELDGIIKTSLESNFVQRCLKQYYQNECYLGKFPHRKQAEQEHWHKRLIELSPDAVPFEVKDIEKNISLAKKNYKMARFEISDREAVKISWDINSVGSLVALLSTLSIVAGFTYSYVFYDHFGIHVSQYFNISDYISSSIERLYIIFFSVFVGVAVMFWGAHHTSRKPIAQIEHENTKPDYFVFLITSLLIVILLGGLISGGRNLHSGISTAILLFGFLTVPRLTRKFFNNFLYSLLSIMVVVSFTSELYGTIYDDIYDIIEGKNTDTVCEQLVFEDGYEVKGDTCQMVVLGGTSGHMFIYDRQSENTLAVPRSFITKGTYSLNGSQQNVFDKLSDLVRGYIKGSN